MCRRCMLPAASERPGVLRVDTVTPPRPAQSRTRVISQGVGLHGADAWHNAGYRGNRVKVGVIDSGFEGFRRLMGSELPDNVTARCYFEEARAPSSSVADCEVDGDHGTAVAETLVDVAPEVELYIANPHSNGDLRNAVDWMAGQGVAGNQRIAGLSIRLGPGDGTSPFSNSPLNTIDAAVVGWHHLDKRSRQFERATKCGTAPSPLTNDNNGWSQLPRRLDEVNLN